MEEWIAPLSRRVPSKLFPSKDELNIVREGKIDDGEEES